MEDGLDCQIGHEQHRDRNEEVKNTIRSAMLFGILSHKTINDAIFIRSLRNIFLCIHSDTHHFTSSLMNEIKNETCNND